MATNLPSNIHFVWGKNNLPNTPHDQNTIENGFVLETPTFQKVNSPINKLSQSLVYLFERGVSEWNSNIDYQPNAFTIASDGQYYINISGTELNNSNPVLDNDGFKWMEHSQYLKGLDTYSNASNMVIDPEFKGIVPRLTFITDRDLISSVWTVSHTNGTEVDTVDIDYTGQVIGQDTEGVLPRGITTALKIRARGTGSSLILDQEILDSINIASGEIITCTFFARRDLASVAISLGCQIQQYFDSASSDPITSMSDIESNATTSELSTTWKKYTFQVTLPSIYDTGSPRTPTSGKDRLRLRIFSPNPTPDGADDFIYITGVTLKNNVPIKSTVPILPEKQPIVPAGRPMQAIYYGVIDGADLDHDIPENWGVIVPASSTSLDISMNLNFTVGNSKEITFIPTLRKRTVAIFDYSIKYTELTTGSVTITIEASSGAVNPSDFFIDFILIWRNRRY